MAISNHERVGKALDLLKTGLGPFVDREMKSAIQAGLSAQVLHNLAEDPMIADRPIAEWDSSALLKLMWDAWNEVFRKTLGFSERSLVSEIRDWRNKWAHQEPFSSDDADRALDSIARLLTAVSASQADEVTRMKMELRRNVIDQQVRSEKHRAGGSLIEVAASGGLKPWREIVTPHADVASGRYQQAEFAADLWQVYLGEGTEEYRNPAEFFRRTYLTESLKQLLVGAMRRLSGTGGDPVIQLQTNFGGGKTHSMLALYHMVSGVAPGELSGIDALLADAGIGSLPKAKSVVLVGNKVSPGNPIVKPDGTVVRTLWGELAYQLGGAEAFARVAADDEKATSPGDVLRELFNKYGPSLILIDEWVAYARQLHDQSDLPGGSFETQFTFAQALTESAKAAKNCLVVVSLPASDTTGSPHTQADDVEVGGMRGREALDRLRNVVGRVESVWRPASAEEGFEIVRRRLFEPIVDPASFKAREITARAFADLYRTNSSEFPPDCRDADYEQRIRDAFPIHPEIFDRLYEDWSTLVKFQRTRGVLRLMAAVIHSLWENGDHNPLILPSTIPIDDRRVQFELTRYLSDNWVPIIEKDIDGPNSLPLKIDSEVPNLGKLQATRRIARTIYLGSAPTSGATHMGLEDRRVRLGCVMPGESPAVFGDALRRLAATATYLYQDGPRVWYSTQPTVTKLAEDRAEQLKRNPDKVAQELSDRLRENLKNSGLFRRVHLLPASSAEVPDDLDARLVILGADYPFSKESGNKAEAAAKAILESRGTTPRLYRNSLVFLAADKVRLQDLDEALRKYLAWQSIVDEKLALNIDPHQAKQAESQMQAANGTVSARLPETFQWLLVPSQSSPQVAISWEAIKLTGSDALAARAGRKLQSDELLIGNLGPTILRKYLDEVPLWRGDHVAVRQLVEDFAQYLYLPRLAGPDVLANAIGNGLGLLTWETDTYAYADSFDDLAKRFKGIRVLQHFKVSADSSGVLVKPDVAANQLAVETAHRTNATPGLGGVGVGSGSTVATPTDTTTPDGSVPVVGSSEETAPAQRRPRRFHGSVRLDPTRVGRDASRIADEIISHLAGIVGADVSITLEIEAEIPDGATEQVVRTVTENSRTLKFTSQGFEEE